MNTWLIGMSVEVDGVEMMVNFLISAPDQARAETGIQAMGRTWWPALNREEDGHRWLYPQGVVWFNSIILLDDVENSVLRGLKFLDAWGVPEGWKTDFTWLLARNDAEIHALLAYCTAHALDGLEEEISARGHRLDRVEAAMDFDLREWWTPTADSYFRNLNKKQLSATLAEMGNDAAAREVLDMKKDTAAARVEREAAALRWLPDWMVRREAVTEAVSVGADTPESADHTATEAANDAATDTHHAA